MRVAFSCLLMLALLAAGSLSATAAQSKPNIIVIWGDDVGFTNLSIESYDQAPGPRATLSQQKTYLFNELLERIGKHMATLQKYPPKQKSSSLSVGN